MVREHGWHRMSSDYSNFLRDQQQIGNTLRIGRHRLRADLVKWCCTQHYLANPARELAFLDGPLDHSDRNAEINAPLFASQSTDRQSAKIAYVLKAVYSNPNLQATRRFKLPNEPPAGPTAQADA